MDAETGSPVTGAKILSPNAGGVLSVADSEGNFEISPEYSWHAVYFIGSISYSLLPTFSGITTQKRPYFEVESDGYKSVMIAPRQKLDTEKGSELPLILLHPK